MPVTDEPHSARGNEREQGDGKERESRKESERERERGRENERGGGRTQEREVVLRGAEDIWTAMRSEAGALDLKFMPLCRGEVREWAGPPLGC